MGKKNSNYVYNEKQINKRNLIFYVLPMVLLTLIVIIVFSFTDVILLSLIKNKNISVLWTVFGFIFTIFAFLFNTIKKELGAINKIYESEAFKTCLSNSLDGNLLKKKIYKKIINLKTRVDFLISYIGTNFIVLSNITICMLLDVKDSLNIILLKICSAISLTSTFFSGLILITLFYTLTSNYYELSLINLNNKEWEVLKKAFIEMNETKSSENNN